MESDSEDWLSSEKVELDSEEPLSLVEVESLEEDSDSSTELELDSEEWLSSADIDSLADDSLSLAELEPLADGALSSAELESLALSLTEIPLVSDSLAKELSLADDSALSLSDSLSLLFSLSLSPAGQEKFSSTSRSCSGRLSLMVSRQSMQLAMVAESGVLEQMTAGSPNALRIPASAALQSS